MDLFETTYLPVADLPTGDGWEMVSGNVTHNSWRRPGALLVAATDALDCYFKTPNSRATLAAMSRLEIAVQAASRRNTP